MRISTKGRYGLSVMVALAQKNSNTSVLEIANNLSISKIYLEQVFSSLKKGNLIVSHKGSGGGYSLAKPSKEISAYDILLNTESALFDKTESCVNSDSAKSIDAILQQKVFLSIDTNLKNTLQNIYLDELASGSNEYMFYI